MNMIDSIWTWLKGKKTYMVVGAYIACVVLEKGFGWSIPGVNIGDNWPDMVWTMLGVGALRNGLPKVVH